VRPAKPTPPDSTRPEYLAELLDLAKGLGLYRVGVTDASLLDRSRVELFRRRESGLSDTMGFTFRDPIRSTDPGRAVEGARSIIVAALSYHLESNADPVSNDEPRPLVARVAKYAQQDFYTPLRRALQQVALRLRADGFRAVVFADENDLVDREVAWRAGLGWFGKNANLLLPGAGSWFVLGSVVTDAPLTVATRPVADGCGSCRSCLDDCPTGAIVEPGVVDARRCLAWLVQKPGVFPREYRVALGDRIYGCDDCQESCPPTVRLADRVRGRVDVPGPGATVDLLEILGSSDDELLARYGRWYLAERDPRWLRRNALVILGNVADPSGQDQVVEVLHRYLVGDDPLLRSHALWAAHQLGLHDLCSLVAEDPDPVVQDELAALGSIS
jgi:epoxyqueuosine reductase